MNIRFLYFLVLLLLLNFLSINALNINKEVLNYKSIIDQYYFSFNYKKLESIVSELDNIECSNNDDIFFINYYRGICNYCLGRIYYNYDKSKAFTKFELGLNDFLKCNKIKDDAEILAMISASYGKLSSLSIVKAFYYGLKAKNYIENAYEIDSNNPKVLMVAATHLMHTPAIYGGDKSKARLLLSKIFNNTEYKSDTKINWANYAEANAYMAQLEILLDSTDIARKYMKKALEYYPKYGFVLYDLEKQLKEK